MAVIGLLFGMEQTFPAALRDRINQLGAAEGISCEWCMIDNWRMDEPKRYDVVLDRISQDVPFYRSVLKNMELWGTHVVNNPFWWSADEKFFSYAACAKMGVSVPRTALVPSKDLPPDTSGTSFRNLRYPLGWQQLFDYIGFPAFFKPHAGGGWKNVYKVHDAEEFFKAYDETGTLVMTLQQSVEFEEYYRCYVIGRKHVRIMPYEPRNPHHERYQAGFAPSPEMRERIERDCLTICNTLGYEFNTVEFAVQDGVPYAIDFTNPAPDAERTSVGEENFEWVVQTAAEYLMGLARKTSGEPLTSKKKSSTAKATARATAEKATGTKSAELWKELLLA
jgi:glutathione synthase/RimK-type ligase-like ATP-grasp enzyme